MSYEDTIVKIAVSFGILAVGAIVGWMLPALFLPAMIVGFVLALVNIFKKKPSRALVLLISGAVVIGSAWLARLIAVARPVQSDSPASIG
jgi:hypothetical protein